MMFIGNVTVLCGLPASGKSTYAAKVKQDNPSTYILSRDVFVEQVAVMNGVSRQVSYDFFASDINYSYMCWHNYLLKSRKSNIVIDNMNLKQFQRDRTKCFQEKGYKISFVFFEPPKNEIEHNKWSKRLLSRPEKHIPLENLMEMQKDYCQTVSPSAIVQPDEVIRINNWSE